jgi:hypothetical protein
MESLRQFNPEQHIRFLREKLTSLLPKDSFAYRLRYSIGRQLDSMLIHYRQTYPESSPAEAVFLLLSENETVDLDWFADVDGQLFDDWGQRIPTGEVSPISSSQQMAAYGLWLIEGEWQPSLQVPELAKPKPRFRSKLQKFSHEAECARLANDALEYAIRLSKDVTLSPEETNKVQGFDFKEEGRKGGKARQAGMNALKLWTLDRYLEREQQFKSASHAASVLKREALAHADETGVKLSEENAEKTLASWIRTERHSSDRRRHNQDAASSADCRVADTKAQVE